MVEVKWHPDALQNLEDIFRYISNDSPFYANAIIDKINSSTLLLKKFKKMGRKVPEVDNELINSWGFLI